MCDSLETSVGGNLIGLIPKVGEVGVKVDTASVFHDEITDFIEKGLLSRPPGLEVLQKSRGRNE